MNDYLKLRIEALLNAQRRIRSSFFWSILSSALVFIVVFNLSFSWSKYFPDRTTDSWAKKEGTKEEIKLFIDRKYYQIPLLGLQIDVTDDIGVFAPLALLIFSFYYLSCTRSAYVQLCSLKEYFDKNEGYDPMFPGLIASEMVLNTMDQDEKRHLVSPSFLYRMLIFLPALAAMGALIVDIHGYFEQPWDNPAKIVWQTMSSSDHIKAVVFDTFGLACTVLMLSYNYYAYIYVKNFRATMQTMIPKE